MAEAARTPILACVDKETSTLAVYALQAGWLVETIDRIVDSHQKMQVALVEVHSTLDIERVRRELPLALVR